ncbi:Low-affinity inorganic phosphate transporter 1 [Sphingomonas sp. S2M10]|uniref:inorganic phosphate transporter n=1 Tax=Sphingomonas sp. S2M10 TaxID=2705010 RepID=UPI0016B3B035|nr:inorganic phosphate transporter [Sphingomonas sp. S2M10]NLS26571.1 Low-affinity inorganic phosphate transporter 1 [Sphingomonas sp. S2M10]
MATLAMEQAATADLPRSPRFNEKTHPVAKLLFAVVLIGGLGFAGWSILLDTRAAGEQMALGVFAFLGLALIIALAFEFVNGFHDTANAVATVIYTNSMPAQLAVVWSGFFNFLGVMLSSGAVAYAIITLLPVDLILNVGSAAGFSMIFALLFAAVLWNLATWYVGLPNSSSHALIGSVLGVGFANQLILGGSRGGTAGVDWSQAGKVFSALLWSPLLGFAGALLLLLAMRVVFMKSPQLFQAPSGNTPPPRGIRALLIGTCTAVSFFHGSNDGQKGMGLIMLILIGCAPTAYALNRTLPASATAAFVQTSYAANAVFRARSGGVALTPVDARATLTEALQHRKAEGPKVYAALDSLSASLTEQVSSYGSLSKVPARASSNVRNDMYLVLDTTRLATKKPDGFNPAERETLKAYQKDLEGGTRFIPLWVKIVVAIALGLGTMIGWKRIVVTVGEKIGKQHMTYGMGAAAEIVAAATIMGADHLGVPVSTTHILSSGVAGASVGSGAGLQFRTIRNMALAWLMTLPAAMLLSGGLYWLMLNAVRIFGL